VSIGLIGSPSSWLNGTVLTPTWAQTVQDNINGWINGTGPTLRSLQIDGVGGVAPSAVSGLYLSGGSHIIATQSVAATGAFNTGAGTGPSGLTLGSDGAGVISFTTGTSPSGITATIVDVTFNNPYPALGNSGLCIVLTPFNNNAALTGGNTGVYATATQPGGPGTPYTGWALHAGLNALSASTQYKWSYFVLIG